MKLANIAKLATAGVGLSTLTINSAAFAASGINFGTVNTQIAGTTENADTAITTIFNNAALFIFLIAVCYGVYGGYLYLTASGEEEQTKKAKVIFKQVAIGNAPFHARSNWLIGRHHVKFASLVGVYF